MPWPWPENEAPWAPAASRVPGLPQPRPPSAARTRPTRATWPARSRRTRLRLPTKTLGASGRKASGPVASVRRRQDEHAFLILLLIAFEDRPSIVVNEFVHVQNDQTKCFE